MRAPAYLPRTIPLPDLGPELGFVAEPIVDLRTNKVHALEVLARPTDGTTFDVWSEGRLELVSLPVLRLALQHAASLPALRLKVHVNVTARDLAVRGLGRELVRSLPIRVRRALILELTEHQELGDDLATRTNLGDLRHAGVRFAVDDFGEGWSNAVTLRRLRPSVVKVRLAALLLGDRWDHEAASWLHTCASSVGARSIVVEQLESPADVVRCRAAGFALGQGRWFHGHDRLAPKMPTPHHAPVLDGQGPTLAPVVALGERVASAG